ncbi:MAG: hypothetical protein OEL89_01685 [Candidatus Peregrinibacteria bacterium]|nr:hypothetical protein [Candidatus Peregrinibacteria bacterium]
METVKAFLEMTKSQFHSVISLILGTVLLISGFVFIDDFLAKFLDDELYRSTIYIFAFLVWGAFWAYYKFKLPRNKKEKIGIVVAIYAENEVERQKLKLDFLSELKNNLRSEGILDISNVIFLKNHQAQKIVEADKPMDEIVKINKKIKGHFYIWGNVKKRPDNQDERYCLFFNGYVIHKPIAQELSTEISRDFSAVLPREINFLEREFKGFEASAKIVHLAVKYVLGLAAFVSHDPHLAFRLHNGLREQFNAFKPIPPHLQQIRNKIPILLSDEALWISKLYLQRGDINNVKKFLSIAIRENEKSYGIWLLKAMLDFQDNKVQNAFKSIKKAKQYSLGQLEWRYSEAFLFFWERNYKKALNSCKNIKKNSYNGEDATLQEVRNFNLSLLDSNNCPQLYFWIGYLSYFKEKNLAQALLDFEKFEEQADESMVELIKKSNDYLKKLRKDMQIVAPKKND